MDKKQYTKHGIERIKERTDISKHDLKMLSKYAIKNGMNLQDIPPGPFKSYVGYKVHKENKRIKIYRGYVFIFFKTSYRLITCYPIPEKHIDEYNKIIKNKKSKKNY